MPCLHLSYRTALGPHYVLLGALLACLFTTVPVAADQPITIGVIAYRSQSQTQIQWQPLADALKQAIPGYHFIIKALPLHELDQAVADRKLDFVLTNPGHYVLMCRRNGLSAPLATLAIMAGDRPLTAFGGVIFSRKQRMDIGSLIDLQGKTIAVSDIHSLGGYQMQLLEMRRQGMRIRPDKLLITGMPHDNVVKAVLTGRADIGFVRTGVLEAMVGEHKLAPEQIKIINRQNLPAFPQQVSTRLYPEWPFAALPHVDEKLARHVTAALFLIDENPAVIRATHIAGFVIPGDYTRVEDLLRELRMPPFETAPDFTLLDVWTRYRWPLAVAVAAIIFMLVQGLRFWRLNRRLTTKNQLVRRQKQQLQESEYRWKFAIEGSGDGLWDWNMTDNSVFFSKRWKAMLGYSEDELSNSLTDWESRVHPADKKQTLATLQAYLDGKIPIYTDEHRLRCKDGRWKWTLDRGMVVSRSEDGRPTRMIGTQSDITARKNAEEKLQRLTQIYAALSQCNQAIVQCRNESELFFQICRDAVNFGGMKMAWIGLVETGNRLTPVAFYGDGTEYVKGLQITLTDDQPSGRGPSAIAIRQNRPFWCQDFQNDPATAPWRTRGARFGWGSSASLPLSRNGSVVGTINLYSETVNAFDEAEQNLLVEMTANIGHALTRFEHEAERVKDAMALAESRKLLQTIIDTVPLRIFWKDKNCRYLGCNPAYARDVGTTAPCNIIGKNDFQLHGRQQAERNCNDDRQVMQAGLPKLFFEEPQTTAEGRQIWLRSSKVPLRSENNEIIGVLGVYEDITEHKQAEERIQQLANFDALTGLPNRTRLNDHLKYALSLAKHSTGNLAVMFLDLDHFKDINDTLGHSIGDALLVELAKRLCAALRHEDTVSRLGGDEFILLLPGTDSHGAAQVAQKLLDTIAQPCRIEQYELAVTASIGIAVYPDDGMDLETLSRCADTAMYRAKQEGRHDFCFFTREMQAHSARILQLGNALHHAQQRRQLHLCYQPLVSAQDGRILGAEALLRWRHPELGTISPAEFIPIAENNGLILTVGEWVLKTAVSQMKTWLEHGLKPMTIAVNLSAVQFRHPGLPELITRILDEARLPPAYLELELTESVAMNDPMEAITMMDNLHECGVKMSIDDFGTGYSSLSYLKKFKVYKLKIDQSFVRDISTDPEDKAIINAVIRLAESLGLRTIAEGVETAEQLAFLNQQRCDEVQGYYFSEPLLPDQFEAFVRTRAGKTSDQAAAAEKPIIR